MDKVQNRLLFVTTRNLSESAGEGRLVMNRAVALQTAHGIITDILYLRPQGPPPSFSDSPAAGKVVRVPLANQIGFSAIAALQGVRRFISAWLRSNPRGYVIISGAQLYFAPLAVPKARTIIDLHGTLREWVEGEGTTPKDRFLRFFHPFAALAEREALANAAGALVVSADLAAYALSCGAVQTWKIPCGLLRQNIGAEPASSRDAWRERLSIPESATVFVYSGGLSKWQCIREAALLFQRLRPLWPDDCRMLILTPLPEALDAVLGGLDRSGIISRSVPPADVGSALLACDIGLMLRDDNITNQNAFPNKFAEYVAAGLFIITSPGLHDPSELVLRHKLGFLIDPDEVRTGLSSHRAQSVVGAWQHSGARPEFLARSRAIALNELTMESLAAPFAASVRGS